MRRTLSITLVSLAVVLAACSAPSGSVEIRDAWGRPSPRVATNAAFYMTIVGGAEDDALVAASTDACGAVELHTTIMENQTMKMQRLDQIDIPAGGTVELAPGGMHVMCIDKTTEIAPGTVVDLTLEFAKAGPRPVTVEIREQ